MLRFALLVALSLLSCVFVATANAATTRDIIEDCAADEVLQGTYTAPELRKAIRELDGDVAEYGGCLDVLDRALANLQRGNRGGAGGPGGGTFDPTMPGIGTPADEPDGNDLPTEYDKQRLADAAASGNQPVSVGDVKLVPAKGVRVDNSPLPTSLLVALAILAAVGLVSVLPGARTWLPGALRRLRR